RVEPAQQRKARRHVSLCWLRTAAFLFRHEVRQRHRLAELLLSGREQRRDDDRSELRDDAHGGPLRQLRRSSRPRVPGRAAARRTGVLHERRGDDIRSRGAEVMNPHFVNHHPIEPPFPDGVETAMFGMGCFWGAEKKFWQQPGVYSTAVGYAAGHTKNPTYR